MLSSALSQQSVNTFGLMKKCHSIEKKNIHDKFFPITRLNFLYFLLKLIGDKVDKRL